jgi:hypothetical protein
MKISKTKLQELIRNKLIEQPEVAPEPTEVPTKPGTPEKRPNPLRPPKEAPKPGPKGSKEEDDLIKKITDKYLKESKSTSKYSLTELLSEISVDDVKKKFVGDRVGGPNGKVVTPAQFDEIMKATKNKLALALWMIKRIEQEFILPEDIYKWEDYFDIFKRRKNQFPVKDINQIKTEDQIDEFVNKAIELLELEKDPTQKKGVSKEDKFKDLKIGEVEGFKVYKIPQGTSEEMYGAACELGSGTSWCTSTGNTKTWFDRYAKDGPLYIFIGPSGEKYQFHYESNQFMDKNDRSILSRF